LHIRFFYWQYMVIKCSALCQLCEPPARNRSRSMRSAQIITFEIWGSQEKYSIEYNTAVLTWSLGRTVIE